MCFGILSPKYTVELCAPDSEVITQLCSKGILSCCYEHFATKTKDLEGLDSLLAGIANCLTQGSESS